MANFALLLFSSQYHIDLRLRRVTWKIEFPTSRVVSDRHKGQRLQRGGRGGEAVDALGIIHHRRPYASTAASRGSRTSGSSRKRTLNSSGARLGW